MQKLCLYSRNSIINTRKKNSLWTRVNFEKIRQHNIFLKFFYVNIWSQYQYKLIISLYVVYTNMNHKYCIVCFLVFIHCQIYL